MSKSKTDKRKRWEDIVEFISTKKKAIDSHSLTDTELAAETNAMYDYLEQKYTVANRR